MHSRGWAVAALLALVVLVAARPAAGQVAVSRATLAAPGGQALAQSGWRFAPGDDPRWAAAGWDDSGWQTLPPTRPPLDGDAPAWMGIGWYRLRLEVAADAVEPLALALWHWGATEVYLDGQRVGGFGEVSTERRGERTRNPRWRAVILPIDRAGTHVVAVRYSAWPQAAPTLVGRWLRVATPPGFNVRLMTADRYLEQRDRDHVRNVALLTALAVAFTAFAVLHLLFFVLERQSRQNLAFGAYAASLAVIINAEVYRELFDQTVWSGAIHQLIVLSMLAALGLSLVAFVYTSRRRPIPRMAYVVAGLQAILSVVATAAPALGAIAIARALCHFAVVGIALVGAAGARDDAEQGRVALVFAVLIGGTMIVLEGFSVAGVPVADSPRFALLVAALALVLVLASIGHARRFALTSHDLRQQLVRVQELSARERERDRAEADARVERERERAEAERQAHEFEEARVFQLSLLPSRLPDLVGWEAVASMQTASEVGGDYFDARLKSHGTATLVIGDATGHGLRAGSLVAATKGLFQAVGDHPEIGVAMQTMAGALRDLKMRGLFMALTMVRVHTDGRVEIVSAGMPPMILMQGNGETTSVFNPAPPLGAPARFAYQPRTLILQTGDRLVLMTDGLPERLDQVETMFGYDRMPGLLDEHRGLDGAHLGHAVEAALDAWAGRPPTDDATLLIITRH